MPFTGTLGGNTFTECGTRIIRFLSPKLPESESDESEEEGSHPPAAFVETKFCDWCCSYFAQSVTKVRYHTLHTIIYHVIPYYTRKNLTSCSKSANKPSTSCVRTACPKLSTSLEQPCCYYHRRPRLDLPAPACAFLITSEGRKHWDQNSSIFRL